MKERIKLSEITSELRSSYLDYALSVIISRALPDVRDGLKPVQRRILYVMRELGLWPNEKFTKCANIVGNTIARYHPHGDQAVYETLVRLAQDFSMRYPLVIGQGNFGSIDGDPPAAYRYCITGDSIVITNRCLEKIDKIADKEEIENLNIKVLSFGGNINKASKWFDSGIHPVYEVKTYRGYSIKGTSNHPILVLSKDENRKPIFVWKLIGEIEKGDFAVIDRNSDLLWPEKNPLLINYYPQKSGKIKIKKLPLILDENLSFLLGFILAEGSIYINSKKNYKKLHIPATSLHLYKKIKNILKEIFPDTNITVKKRKPSSLGKKYYYSIEISSSYVIEFLENLGLKTKKAKEKEIPYIVFDSNKKTLGAFLRGLFEGGGSITGLKINSPRVILISKSEKLIKETQVILLRFGIVSFRRFDKSKDYWLLIINGKENLEKFLKYINFETKEKIRKLEKAVKSSKGANSKTDYIPYLSSYFRNKYLNSKIPYKYKEWLIKHNIDRYSKIREYYEELRKILDKEDIELINFLIKTNYLFDKIVDKKYVGKERVYSLKIESNCHSFVANGFINHNTEAKLSNFAVEMLADVEKETVDFRPNYDNTRKEPVVLPSRIPQLILNGSLGIAVGMATNIPPHNLVEVSNAIKKLIENPNLDLKQILEIIKGPDFPTGGVVYGKKSLFEAYKTGRGGIVIRGKVNIEETKRGGKRIVITEIPWQVNKAELVEQIANLSLNKILPEIKEIRDESNKEGIRVVIETSEKDDKTLNNIIEKLYRLTDLQKNYYFNFIALEDGIQPKLFNLKDLLLSWINHRREVIRRRTKFDLERTKERIEILEGFKKALQDIDTVIRIIRRSADRETARKNLIQKLKINQRQADAILEMPLRTLTSLETKRIIDELNEKLKLKKELETILKYPKKIDEIIIKETEEVAKKYGDKRKTEIREEEITVSKYEEEIPEEDVLLFINQKRFVKTFKIDTPIEKIIKDKENFGKLILTKTTEKLLAYSKKGKFYSLNVYDFYTSSKYLETNLIIEKGDEILDVIRPVGADNVIIFTKNGLGKKVNIKDIISVKRTGVQGIKLKNDDEVIKVLLDDKRFNIFLIAKDGNGIGIKNDLPVQTRAGSGVKVIKLQNTNLFNASLLNKNYILLAFSNGFFKKISIKEINIQKRGGKGIKIFEPKDKFGELVFADCVNDDDTLAIINEKIEFIKAKNIQVVKRINQPIKILDKITKVELI